MLANDHPEGQQTTLFHTCPGRRATSPLPHLFFLVPGAALTLGREGLGEPGVGSWAGGPRAPARSLTWAPASRGRAGPLLGAGSPRCGGSCAARLAGEVRAGRPRPAPGVAGASGGTARGPAPRQRSSVARPQGLARRHRGPASAGLSRRPSPRGTGPVVGAADPAGSARSARGGPRATRRRPPPRVAAYVREAKPRTRRKKKTTARGRKGKNFIFSLILFWG